MRLAMRVTAAAVVTLGLFAIPLTAGGPKKSDAMVKAKVKVESTGPGKTVFSVHLDIKPGWHLYANPVGNEDLIGGQTTLTVGGEKKPLNVKIDYPPGKQQSDKIFGKYAVYENGVVLRVAVDRAAGDASPLDVRIRVQACDDKNCLLPGAIQLSVP